MRGGDIHSRTSFVILCSAYMKRNGQQATKLKPNSNGSLFKPSVNIIEVFIGLNICILMGKSFGEQFVLYYNVFVFKMKKKNIFKKKNRFLV